MKYKITIKGRDSEKKEEIEFEFEGDLTLQQAGEIVAFLGRKPN